MARVYIALVVTSALALRVPRRSFCCHVFSLAGAMNSYPDAEYSARAAAMGDQPWRTMNQSAKPRSPNAPSDSSLS